MVQGMVEEGFEVVLLLARRDSGNDRVEGKVNEKAGRCKLFFRPIVFPLKPLRVYGYSGAPWPSPE